MTLVQVAGPWVAARAARLRGEGAFEVLAAARRLEAGGREVAHLEIGELDVETPPHVVEAGLRALRDGDRRYSAPAGLPELRDAVAGALSTRGVAADAGQVVVTSGGKPALFAALLALIEPGDEVLVPDPGFPSFTETVRFAGGIPVGYELDAANAFALDPEAIAARITAATRVLVINAPHNPTGGSVRTEAALAGIAALAQRHDLWIVSDEVYARLAFAGEPRSVAALAPERTVIVDSFSKSHAMSGWRLGYLAAPPAIAPALERFVIHSASCTPPFVQRAGIAALTGPADFVDTTRRRLVRQAERLVAGLNAVPGVQCQRPAGSLFAFPDVRGVLAGTGEGVDALARRLLQDHGVAVLPGTAFGAGGTGHLRVSFATTSRNIGLALEGLAASSRLQEVS